VNVSKNQNKLTKENKRNKSFYFLSEQAQKKNKKKFIFFLLFSSQPKTKEK
jgi:hypothetical protein